MIEADQFFAYANEREHIRLAKKNGAPRAMWTKDPVLQKYRFCNVFREDDRTTVFFARTVREPLSQDPSVLMATIAWRWFNRIETCERVPFEVWAACDLPALETLLRPVQESKDPLVTGAYMVKTPLYVDKLTGILACLKTCKEHEKEMRMHAAGKQTLESLHSELLQMPYIGKFMAYEIVTDIRHTYLLHEALDLTTWASAGPGALRGLGWVCGEAPPSYAASKAQGWALKRMRQLLAESQVSWNYPERPWEMREVEHTLCEYDKYRRGQEGQRLKRKYQS